MAVPVVRGWVAAFSGAPRPDLLPTRAGSLKCARARCRYRMVMGASADRKQLRLRRPGWCAGCGRELPAGELATWDAAVRTVTCLECERADAGALEGEAGASAQREYDRRRQARQRHARQTFGALGTVLARVIDEPQSTTRWEQ